MSKEHGLILLETEIDEIVRVVEKMQPVKSETVGHESYFSFYNYVAMNFTFDDNTSNGDLFYNFHDKKVYTEKEVFELWKLSTPTPQPEK